MLLKYHQWLKSIDDIRFWVKLQGSLQRGSKEELSRDALHRPSLMIVPLGEKY